MMGRLGDICVLMMLMLADADAATVAPNGGKFDRYRNQNW